MQYYSTNHNAPFATLREAVVRGLAPDRGLYMPEVIIPLPQSLFSGMKYLSFQETSYIVARAFFGDDVEADALKRIVFDTLQFDCPLVKVSDRIYSLELFHGPTLAFKDVGARFMARLLQHFIKGEEKEVNVLVATSGDTGSAVANGFLGVEGIHVYVLYPKGKVSPRQESQFTTLGRNITAVEVDGVFDDCQALVKSAFMDKELNEHMKLTSANSINVARFLPQAFYYFWAVAQLMRMMPELDMQQQLVVCVPSGNFGNITAALFGHQMGLPVHRFIAACNANDVFYKYIQTGKYEPQASIATIANAMDVGTPSNFARIQELYSRLAKKRGTTTWQEVRQLISATTYNDDEIREAMASCHAQTGYTLDPHGACGYRALTENLQAGEVGIFCETAHPAKFSERVEPVIGASVPVPERLANFMRGEKKSVPMSRNFDDFKQFLMQQ